MIEPDWYADDFDSWGDPDGWPPDWHIKSRAALIRHFSHIDVKVEYLGGGKFSIKPPHQSALEFHVQSATDYLDGFLRGCELMAEQWDCRERTDWKPVEGDSK